MSYTPGLEIEAYQCVIPEKIHAHPMVGDWKFLGGGGSYSQTGCSFLRNCANVCRNVGILIGSLL